jgi:nucleotide-binding universal stress UspA family protein
MTARRLPADPVCGKEETMNTIVVAVDGSPSSDEALRFAVDFAATEGARLVLVHVAPSVDCLAGSFFATTVALPHEVTAQDCASLEAALELAAEHGIPATSTVLVGDPAAEIVTHADSIGADLIVIGSRGLGALGRLLLGSVSRGVLRESRRPVIVVRESAAPAHAAAA